jgi:hypothetical protein
MTEAEWMACEDPAAMLPLLREKGTARVPMLYSASCLRRVWHLVTDERSRALIESTELFLDGLVSEEEAACVYDAYESAYLKTELRNEGGNEIDEAVFDLAHVRFQDAISCSNHIACAVGDISSNPDDELAWEVAFKAEKAAQVRLLRDIFGNPFRPVAINPAWQTPTVVALAQAAYDNRTLPGGTLEPARLAVLADALEEAGCDNGDILKHLRQPGEHVRGCWAVDLLLGKE